MRKKAEKALNEKLNVRLPENLSKKNIVEQLENVQQNTKITEIPKKRNNAKKLIPVAASLAVAAGLLGAYFGMGLGLTDAPKNNVTSPADKTEVVRYQSYDKIYDRFDALRKEYKDSIFFNDSSNFLNGFGSDDNSSFGYDGEKPESAINTAADLTGSTATNINDGFEDKNYGATNTQENGVDEGDIIKTDGKYLYIANAGGSSVSIVEANGGEMKISSQINVDDKYSVSELYISGNRLIIVGTVSDGNTFVGGIYADYIYSTCCVFAQGDTFVKIYDISRRTAPKLVTEYSQQGNYNNSRMLDGKIICISEYIVDISDKSYRNKCIPEITVNGDAEKITADCISVIEENPSAKDYAVITTFDIENGKEPTSEAVLGNCDKLYASPNGLFLSETCYDEEEITKIYRFEYTDTGVKYKYMGKVSGYIDSQFSMSYDGEHFRIATTVNKLNGISGNNLYILNNDMRVVGKVEDLAQGETIQSVRFVGDTAYVVTFRQTDPLFVIDLSDPENPKVKGELKIPGFSEYLHPIADGLLIGVGQNGTSAGTNGDCKVSLFDVSNPYEPKETSVVTVSGGKAYTWTPVSYNHKSYITLSNNEFAVPFTLNWYSNMGKATQSGSYYIRYRLTDNKICEIARYKLSKSNGEMQILGATYIENTFYVITECYGDGTYAVAFDLEKNEETGRLKTASWESAQ